MKPRPFCRIAVILAALFAVGGATAEPAKPILDEHFDQPTLDAAWTVDVSAGNTVALKGGVVEIKAAENTYAHLQRPLTQDHVRASAELQAGNGISWCTSVFAYWKPADWCQIGVIPRGDGRYYVCVTTHGQRAEYDLARCRFKDWHFVGIELGEDCLRFVSSADGVTWKTELFVPRPAELMGPPTLLVVGKGYGVDAASPNLNSNYGAHGDVAVSHIRRVTVEPLPPDRLHVTDAERRAKQRADADPLGAQILERPGDPDFDTVAAVFPPLSKPREVVGVKDHRYEVGVEYDGTVQLADDSDSWEQTGATAYFELGTPAVRFGTDGCRKRLSQGYLPVVVSTWERDGLQYEETIAGWSEGMSTDKDLWAYVKLSVTNPAPSAKRVDVALQVRPESPDFPTQRRTLDIPAGGTAVACFKIPSPPKGRQLADVPPAEFQQRLDEVTATWTKLLNTGMTIDVPEARVNDAYRAWLAYNYLNVDKTPEGRYEPHDGAGFYEGVFGYSAVLYCHSLDLWGRHDDARRYLESLLTMVKPDGLFYVNYGLPDHGSLMIALAEHFRLTGDAEWLRKTAPMIVKMSDRLLVMRDEAVADAAHRTPLTRGLIKAAPYADYQTPTYSYYGNAYACAALERVADMLGKIDRADDARRYADAAAAYRRDILASMDAAAFDHDGQKLLPMEPDTRRLLVSGRYRTGGYYGLIAPMMLESELLPPDDPRALLVVRGLERRGGLILGMCEFDDGIDHAYTYGYWLNCLHRDDIKRVLLGFYGMLAYGMGRDTYCGVEVTQITTGEPTPTTPHLYSGTQQLRLLRMMLVQEEGDELVLGRAIPRAWLAPGKHVTVKNAPTRFGPVSFTIEAAAAGGSIAVQFDPPTRTPPRAIRLVVRHPDGKPIKAATIDGRPAGSLHGEALELLAPKQAVRIEIAY